MTAHPTPSLSSLLPLGQLATRGWLLQQGLQVYEVDNALKAGRIVALARGVFARPDLPVTWPGVAASLRSMSAEVVYVGGLSALVQHGLSHYASFATEICFYSPLPKPSWLGRADIATKLDWVRTQRLWQLDADFQTKSLKEMPVHDGYWLLASPEQAYLELLALVPKKLSFELADNIMQGLPNLSPRRLDFLLNRCQHVVAKRLFFFFSERHQHAWRERLDAKNYDLGTGKRSLTTGGKLVREYQITVPRDLYD